MFFNYSQTAFVVGTIIQFPDYVFGTVPIPPSEVGEVGQAQGTSTNTLYGTGTTQQTNL